MLGVGDRENVNLEPRLESRQSLNMSHRERETVPEGRTNERKAALSLELHSCVCSEIRKMPI